MTSILLLLAVLAVALFVAGVVALADELELRWRRRRRNNLWK